jgi:PAS domain S-box-containing protein
MTLDMAMVGHHDHWLVALSIVISILGAYAARELVQRVREARRRMWTTWLIAGAVVDGIGTWSMHYTGKLALHLPVSLLLDWPTVLLSLLVGIMGSAGALALVGRGRVGWPRALAASFVLGGVGVSGLHYTAMAAIRVPEVHSHTVVPVIISIILAIVLSQMAIAVAFLIGNDNSQRRLKYHGGTWLRGAANPVMHYTAMAAVTFTYPTVVPDLSHAVSISSLGILGISIVPIILLVVLLLTSLIDKFWRQKEILQKIFDYIPVMISFFDKEGRVELVNREWERTRGQRLQDITDRDPDILNLVYADPIDRERARRSIAAATGEWSDFRTVTEDGRVVDTAWAVVRLSDGTSISIGQDVTERRRTEKSLRESEERFRQFAENIQDVIWMVDSEVERAVYLNPAYEKVWGMPRESVYRNMHAFMEPAHPDDREILVRMLKDQREAKLVTAEYRIIRPDGIVRWIRDRSFPVRNAEGKVYRIAGVAEDITEKKRAEERLLEYEKVVEGLEEMIVVVDRDYRYLIANRAFLNYRGVSKEELIGRPITEFLDPEVFEKETKWRLDEAFAGQVVKYDLKYLYPSLGKRLDHYLLAH